MINWSRLIELLLPIRLRKAKRYIALIDAMLSNTIADAQRGYQYHIDMIDEHKNIGQREVIETLVRDKFGIGIKILGQEDGRVVLFGKDREVKIVGRDKQIIIITSVDRTDVGCDFIVQIPEGADAEAVAAYISKFILAGIGFRVEYITNTLSLTEDEDNES